MPLESHFLAAWTAIIQPEFVVSSCLGEIAVPCCCFPGVASGQLAAAPTPHVLLLTESALLESVAVFVILAVVAEAPAVVLQTRDVDVLLFFFIY